MHRFFSTFLFSVVSINQSVCKFVKHCSNFSKVTELLIGLSCRLICQSSFNEHWQQCRWY